MSWDRPKSAIEQEQEQLRCIQAEFDTDPDLKKLIEPLGGKVTRAVLWAVYKTCHVQGDMTPEQLGKLSWEYILPLLRVGLNNERSASSGTLSPTPPKSSRKPRSRKRSVVDLRKKIRQLKADYRGHFETCERLDASGIKAPEDAAWRNLTWVKAYTDRKFVKSVRSYISKARQE